ncbi:hypothetical protein BV133_1976 [Blastochloris viridis]|uniref:Uncharacterized protein n=1 Tax=Blastochloris viridis TaxID=1079 RepID=A0A182D293_BLAVI|nr:hypothetical protein BV133_1976 [Blastochloris viridis]
MESFLNDMGLRCRTDVTRPWVGSGETDEAPRRSGGRPRAALVSTLIE